MFPSGAVGERRQHSVFAAELGSRWRWWAISDSVLEVREDEAEAAATHREPGHELRRTATTTTTMQRRFLTCEEIRSPSSGHRARARHTGPNMNAGCETTHLAVLAPRQDVSSGMQSSALTPTCVHVHPESGNQHHITFRELYVPSVPGKHACHVIELPILRRLHLALQSLTYYGAQRVVPSGRHWPRRMHAQEDSPGGGRRKTPNQHYPR